MKSFKTCRFMNLKFDLTIQNNNNKYGQQIKMQVNIPTTEISCSRWRPSSIANAERDGCLPDWVYIDDYRVIRF